MPVPVRGVLTAVGFLLLPTLMSCSSAAWYQGVQAQQRKACLDGPSSEYAACMERANRTYELYRREREDRLAKP